LPATRYPHRPAHRGFVRPFSQASTDTDLLIEGSSVLSVRPPRTPTCSSRWRPLPATRHPHRSTYRGFVRPFSQAPTDTDLLIEVANVSAVTGSPADSPGYLYLPPLAVAPLRRFCDPAFPFVRPSASLARVSRTADADGTGQDTDLLIECPSRPRIETDGFSEDTDLLIEVANVSAVTGSPADSPGYRYLPPLAVAPLRRFCDPAFPFVRPSASLARDSRTTDADGTGKDTDLLIECPSRPRIETDGFSEDTDPLIEASSVASIPRRSTRPAQGLNFITPAPSSRYWENSPPSNLRAS